TGVAMSPAVMSVAPVLVTLLGGQQTARTIHFVVASGLVIFLVGHVVMVILAGFTTRLRRIIPDREAFSRRKLITGGLATAAGASGVAVAASVADRFGLIPPDHFGVYGAGETLTYSAQRVLTSSHSMAREFSRGEISKVSPVNGGPPNRVAYQR